LYLTNEIFDFFVKNSIDDGKSSESLRLASFIGELYNLEVLGNDCINFVLEFLLNTGNTSNDAVDCIDAIICSAGDKLEEKNRDKMERYFTFFKFVVENEGGKSYKAKIYKHLLDNRSRKSNKDQDYETIWKIVANNHEEIESYALLCSEISARSDSNFCGKLADFIVKQPNDGNVNKILFIAELYKYGLIDNEILTFWIKPSDVESLSAVIVTKIINAVSCRKDVEMDVEITALLMVLEEIVADESEKVFDGLKQDLLELTSIMSHKIQNTE
jgi:hypothetical protein